jgi:hypothetical protein
MTRIIITGNASGNNSSPVIRKSECRKNQQEEEKYALHFKPSMAAQATTIPQKANRRFQYSNIVITRTG